VGNASVIAKPSGAVDIAEHQMIHENSHTKGEKKETYSLTARTKETLGRHNPGEDGDTASGDGVYLHWNVKEELDIEVMF